MTHLDDDALLLFAYGEAPEHEGHMSACAECRARLRHVEDGRVLLELGTERSAPARGNRMVWATIAMAAGLVGLMAIAEKREGRTPAAAEWRSTLSASPEAGYVTDAELMNLDAQLGRLERGGRYEQAN